MVERMPFLALGQRIDELRLHRRQGRPYRQRCERSWGEFQHLLERLPGFVAVPPRFVEAGEMLLTGAFDDAVSRGAGAMNRSASRTSTL